MAALADALTEQISEMMIATGILSFGIFLVMRTLTRLAGVSSSYWRIQPIIPPVLGVLGALGGAVALRPGTPLVIVGINGLAASYLAEKMHKILGQTVLGDDVRIGGDRDVDGKN